MTNERNYGALPMRMTKKGSATNPTTQDAADDEDDDSIQIPDKSADVRKNHRRSTRDDILEDKANT